MTATVLWTHSDAAAACRAAASGPAWDARGVAIDSRAVTPGDLFVALAGPRFDGHDFLPAAFAAGAVAALISDGSKMPAGHACLTVADTLAGLGRLGIAARRRTTGRIAAVTGSVGKTGVKEALRHVLARQGGCHASVASFNNHWGVPLSLARLPAASPFGVFEIGMNHAGEITPLAAMVRPHVAVVTAIAGAHSAHFPDETAIAAAKAEIFSGLAGNGVAVINRDTPHFERLAEAARAAGAARIVGFGHHRGADYRVITHQSGPAASQISADLNGTTCDFTVGLAGPHWVTNSLAVLAAVDALGADTAQAAADLADLAPVPGRGTRHRLIPTAGGTALLIDESYNANPASMHAALSVLAAQPARRRVAVLGDMLELGAQEAKLHGQLAQEVLAQRVDLVHTVGPRMAHLRAALPPARRGVHGEIAADIAAAVAADVRDADVILVKGSLGSRTGHIVEKLLTMTERPRGEEEI